MLRRAEVEAVRHGERLGARRGDVAVRLRQREGRTRARVELAVAAVRVRREGDAQARGLVDAHDAAVVRLGQRRVALDEPVVLVGDPRLRREVRGAQERQRGGPQLLAARGARQAGRRRRVGLERVLPLRARVRALVDRTLVRDRLRVDVDDPLAVVVDREAAGVVHLADDGGLDLPLRRDREERVELVGPDDGHHALLRLRHEDLAGVQRGVTQQHVVEVHVHAAVAVRGELGRGARDARGAEVLDALHDLGGEQLQAALDEHLLHEGVAHLDRRPLGGHAVLERLGGEDRGAADAVAARPRAEEHDLVAEAGRVGEVDVLVPQHAEAERVHERVALVGAVEDELAADVRQAEELP
nr:hypothetical protein GCM10025730_29040 [Promicromonospora thailandica]